MCHTGQIKAKVEKKIEESLKAYICSWNRQSLKGKDFECNFIEISR